MKNTWLLAVQKWSPRLCRARVGAGEMDRFYSSKCHPAPTTVHTRDKMYIYILWSQNSDLDFPTADVHTTSPPTMELQGFSLSFVSSKIHCSRQRISNSSMARWVGLVQRFPRIQGAVLSVRWAASLPGHLHHCSWRLVDLFFPSDPTFPRIDFHYPEMTKTLTAVQRLKRKQPQKTDWIYIQDMSKNTHGLNRN
jgi:hypothetical protein